MMCWNAAYFMSLAIQQSQMAAHVDDLVVKYI